MRTTFDEQEPEDIVKRLLEAHNALPFVAGWGDDFQTLYSAAAEEIVKLRKILGITEN